jgi:hypothetical protein
MGNRKERAHSMPLSSNHEKNAKNSLGDEMPKTKSLSVSVQRSDESLQQSPTKRRKRFLRMGRKQKQSSPSDMEDSKNHGLAAVDAPSPEHVDVVDTTTKTNNKMNDDGIHSNVTRKRSGGFKMLRRLSSPLVLQHFSSDRDSRGSKDTSEESHGFTSDSSCDHGLNPLSHDNRIAVVPEAYSPPRKPRTRPPPDSPIVEESNENALFDDDDDVFVPKPHKFECATAILQHSYLERICGNPRANSSFEEDFETSMEKHHQNKQHLHPLSEDPTVQESIECIFASQLEQGLELWDDAEEDEENMEQISSRRSEIISPTDLQQSRMNRKDRRNNSCYTMNNQTRKRYEQASLVYVGTFDPTVDHDEVMKQIVTAPDGHIDPLPCQCHSSAVPSLNPKEWPQSPILLRPTPGSTTRVKAIRFCNSQDPLWVPGSNLTWWQRLQQHWGRECQEQTHYASCEHCAVCPVNNGNEAPGESLVIDFESDLFEGTLLLRLRFIEGTTPEPYDDTKGYFKGVNRRYQTVVRGRFKKALPFTHMVNGFRCDRKFGKLPAKWILKGGMKVISFFAPQLDAKLDGDRPYSVTPLGSTAQSFAVDDPDKVPTTMEGGLCEPTEAHRCLIGQSSDAPTSLHRAKLRKKVFDKHFVTKSKEFMSDPSKVYTIEFLQHLFNFETFSIELGSFVGNVELEDILDGQPLQIMAAYEEQPLWSFDVWHECLWNRAKANEGS